jgi:hypothetical protein
VPKRYVRGDRAFGRLLKQLPDSVATELRQQLNATGRSVVALQHRRAPVRTGALSSALSYNVTPKRLSLKVGLVGKAINKKLFYGWIVEWGRKAQVVTATHSGTFRRALSSGLNVRAGAYKNAALAAGTKGAYQLHVRAMPARHFVFIPGLREQIYPAYRNIWGKALAKAASGASDD